MYEDENVKKQVDYCKLQVWNLFLVSFWWGEIMAFFVNIKKLSQSLVYRRFSDVSGWKNIAALAAVVYWYTASVVYFDDEVLPRRERKNCRLYTYIYLVQVF